MHNLSPGTTVVVRPEGRHCSDPWIAPKVGWHGKILGIVSDMQDHVAVEFIEPWCELHIPRVMPVTALVEASTCVEEVNKQDAVVRTEPAKVEHQSEWAPGTSVLVKTRIQLSDGEQHVEKRKGQRGVIVHECKIATMCVEVSFGPGSLPVMIPKNYLTRTQPGGPERVARVKTVEKQLSFLFSDPLRAEIAE